MKTITVEKTSINEAQIKFKGNHNKKLDFLDLIEIALDIVPQGGFTPKDIKERSRIQEALDNSDRKTIELEDSDYDALVNVMSLSRWTIRNKELNKLLQNFETGFYKNKKEVLI